MMNRRRFLLTSLAGALAAPLVSEAQQARKVHRIGYVSPEERGQTRGFDNFRMGLRDLGWVEGQNVVIEPRFGDPPEQ